jgi:hypothetical protein
MYGAGCEVRRRQREEEEVGGGSWSIVNKGLSLKKD